MRPAHGAGPTAHVGGRRAAHYHAGMTQPASWLERWLVFHGAAPGDAPGLARRARERAARYPFPMNAAWPQLERWLDVAAPLLLLGTPRRARALDDDAFDRLERALQHHATVAVRAMHTLARYPGLDLLYEDAGPSKDPGHPLLERQDRVRLGTSHVAPDPDVVVIGSGAGGAPAAWSLARAGLRVAIVEAGRLLTAASTHEALEKHYLDQGFVGSADPRGMAIILAGQAVGGTTVINSGTSLRPLDECLRAWDAAAGTSFAGGALGPWLDAVERQCGIRPSRREVLDASAAIVERGFAALGRKDVHVLARNAPGCEGGARCCFGCPNGKKLSTDRAFLPEAVDAGARLLMGTRALSIQEDERGVDVLVEGPDGARRALRARAVVLAAGALGTPALIRNDRLGTHWRLAGDGLRMHPTSKLFALMPAALPHGGVPQGVGYRPPELPNVTFEGVHTPAAAAAPMVQAPGRRHRWWMERYDRLATYGMMIRDRATGSVRYPGGRRVVRYLMDREDARDLGRGVLMTAEAMFAAGAERVLLPLAGVDPEVESVEALRRRSLDEFTPDRMPTAGFHPQGTAAIGRVVDADLRVLGTRRVFVGDASALPGSPGVNPQVTIMALSLRLADRLAGELS